MGTEAIKKQITYLAIFKFAEEIKKLVREKRDSYLQEIVTLLLNFVKSEDFAPFLIVNKENFLFDFFIMCEMGKDNDKYLFIKILFPLLEQLKVLEFERILYEINQINSSEQKNRLVSYYNKNKEIIEQKIITFTNKSKKPFEVLKNIIKNKSEMFGNYLSTMTNILFTNEKISKRSAQHIIDEALSFFKPYFYELKKTKNDNNSFKIVEKLMELYPSLKNIKLVYNITMFGILKAINEDKMKIYVGNNEKNLEISKTILELNDNFTWLILKNFSKEKKMFSGKIKIKEEQVGINIFKIINSSDENNISIIHGYVCKSIFINYNIILMEANFHYYKINKINLEKLKNDLENGIKIIKESNNEYQNLNTYIHLGNNTIILYPQSYDLLLVYLVEEDIINKSQVPEEYRNIIELSLQKNNIQENENINEEKTFLSQFKDKIANNENNNKIYNSKTFVGTINDDKQFIGNNQINQDIQIKENDNLQVNQLKEELEKEKLKNKELSERIKTLENTIIKETYKSKDLELKVNELNNELSFLKERYNNLKNFQEKGGQNTGFDNNLYEQVFEKDKEIKDLKKKISRYPFLLNDGEKIMTIIFTSADQVIHHSVICKNSEVFSIVENRLYDEGFPEYKESENFFTFNGLKVNKNKTMEENNIKNSDVIILNVIDDDDD